jgi:dCMP deaminase
MRLTDWYCASCAPHVENAEPAPYGKGPVSDESDIRRCYRCRGDLGKEPVKLCVFTTPRSTRSDDNMRTGWCCAVCVAAHPEREHITIGSILCDPQCASCGEPIGKHPKMLRWREAATRPRFEEIYMRFTLDLARRSTCRRLQVGCVITSDDFTRVYAVGYNGNVPGGKNDCDLLGEQAVGFCGCVHGESNAVIKCDADKHAPKLVFCTHSPCVMCAKHLILLGGVQRVLYGTPYRKTDALELLAAHRIEVVQLALP